MSDKKESKKMNFIVTHPILSFTILALGALGVFYAYARFLPSLAVNLAKWDSLKDGNNLGVFGDSFGALTSFFSILTMIAVFLAFLYQRKQIELQREELINEKEMNKYEQIPLFSIEEPKVVLHIPEPSYNSHSIESKIGVQFLLRLANDSLVKHANIKIKVKCGKGLSRHEYEHSFDIVGFGGDMKRLHYYEFTITNNEYIYLANNVRAANLMGEDRPILVQISISYFSMLGLHLNMKREYVLRAIGGNEEQKALIAQRWGCALNTPVKLSGDYNEDRYTCRGHFHGNECSIVNFWLTENDDGSTFEIVE